MRRGFTLLEVLTVIAILMVLTAIMAPVFASARRSAQIHASLGRLRQLHQAVEIYRLDYSGGSLLESLPPRSYVHSTRMGLGREFFVSPCGYQHGIDGNSSGISIAYWPKINSSEWYQERYSKVLDEYGDQAMLFSDSHCNLPHEWHSTLLKKRGLGVTIGGKLINHHKVGDPGHFEWWIEN